MNYPHSSDRRASGRQKDIIYILSFCRDSNCAQLCQQNWDWVLSLTLHYCMILDKPLNHVASISCLENVWEGWWWVHDNSWLHICSSSKVKWCPGKRSVSGCESEPLEGRLSIFPAWKALCEVGSALQFRRGFYFSLAKWYKARLSTMCILKVWVWFYGSLALSGTNFHKLLQLSLQFAHL